MSDSNANQDFILVLQANLRNALYTFGAESEHYKNMEKMVNQHLETLVGFTKATTTVPQDREQQQMNWQPESQQSSDQHVTEGLQSVIDGVRKVRLSKDVI